MVIACNAMQACIHIVYTNNIFEPKMPPKKTSILNLRIDPALKESVREAALRDNRSIANLIEVLIRNHCAEIGVEIDEQQSQGMSKGGNG